MIVAHHRRPALPGLAMSGDHGNRINFEPAPSVGRDVAAGQHRLDLADAAGEQAAYLLLATARFGEDAGEQFA